MTKVENKMKEYAFLPSKTFHENPCASGMSDEGCPFFLFLPDCRAGIWNNKEYLSVR
jgi:hypothetical protein